MRCIACNRNLTDFESTRKSVHTGTYLDLCNNCFSTVSKDVPVIERADLLHDTDTTFEEAYEDDYKFREYE